MPERWQTHHDRRRAESFGTAAEEYDRHRPRYPQPLIADLVTRAGLDVLDVGTGTGIAATQLVDAGADVLAVEPDSRMARVATAKGIRVEHASFEQWQPADRMFDLVVFAQSFHWVEPELALWKVASILRRGGRLALLANRIMPTSPTQQTLDEINADYLDVTVAAEAEAEAAVTALIEACGFSHERRRYVEQLHYSTDDYLNLVFTYSNRLVLDPSEQLELRSRLADRIGTAGVDARNDAVAFICTPTR